MEILESIRYFLYFDNSLFRFLVLQRRILLKALIVKIVLEYLSTLIVTFIVTFGKRNNVNVNPARD